MEQSSGVSEEQRLSALIAKLLQAQLQERDASVPSKPEDYGVTQASPIDAIYEKYVTHRRNLGFFVGGFAIVFVVGLGFWSFYSLHHIFAPIDQVHSTFVIAQLIAHAVITIALVFFCYQLLRAAERMLLPYWWASEKVEVAKVLLGIEDPVSTATKMLNSTSDALKNTKNILP
ncbi:hypothetical protein HMI49_13815 [Corallococcus exercitus]|uniref:Uncharacterized protein n=1 Tax=Corallococcus exercitus TaxID=2316736 RepID=A0A7Y4KJX1_9BACT|nr:hypothetical protein [Corallococcus exercitus]NOK34274.1 hypothetical protein [Corallococcus exercitus]